MKSYFGVFLVGLVIVGITMTYLIVAKRVPRDTDKQTEPEPDPIPAIVVITDYSNHFECPENQLKASLWTNKNKHPHLELTSVQQKSKEICDTLEPQKETLGFSDWKLQRIEFQNLYHVDENCWVYVVRIGSDQYPSVSGLNDTVSLDLLILLDGKILLDSMQYPPNISAAVLAIDGIEDCAASEEIRTYLYEKNKREGALF